MSTDKTIVLVFLDEDGKEVKITLSNPAEDLTFETVQSAMETIIDNDAILTKQGKHLENVSEVYYRTVTITPIEDTQRE